MSDKIGKNALLYANGYLSFVHMVNPEQAAKDTAAPCVAEAGVKKNTGSAYNQNDEQAIAPH